MDRTASTENECRHELELLRARVAELENTSDELRRIADAAREGKPRFRAAIEQTQGALLLIDPSDGRIVEVNELACETLGYQREDLLERSASNVDPLYGKDNLAALIESLPASTSRTMESTHRHKNGATFPVEIRLGLVEILGMPRLLSLSRAMPRQAEVERALRESEEKFRSLIDTIPHGVQENDLDGVITLSNAAHCRMHGYADGELVGKTIFDMLASDAERDTLRDYLAKLVREQPAPTPYFAKDRTRDGRIIDVQVDWIYKRDARGRLTGFASVITDITNRKHAEEELRLSKFAIDHCADPVYWVRKDGRFSYVNKAACESLGYSHDELVSMTVHDIDPDFPVEMWPQHWERMKRAGSLTFEARHRRKDGRTFPIEITTNFVEYLGQEYVWAFARDITERKQTEEALKRGEAFLNATGRMARVGGWEVDTETDEIRWTEETYRIHEMPLDYKPTIDEAIGFFHVEDRPKLECAIRQAIDRGEPYDMEIRFITATGKPLWTHTICVPHVVNGKTVRLTGTFQDITDRKRAEEEKEKLADQLRHSQKMEAIGQLAGGVAHDFNNYLTAILANADLLGGLMKNGLNEKSTETVKAGLEEIKNAGKRAAILTRQLVAFSRKDRTKADVVDLREVIEAAEQMLRHMIREEIDFNVEIKQDAHRILADAGQIEQIVMNLVLNARDAITGTGTLTVQCVNVDLDNDHVVTNIGAKPGPHVMLAVSDTGIGMSRRTIEHIFEPFFTTKPRGKGTGLGLATVYGIAKQAGAHISVESEPGKGSTFRVYFPSVEKEA